MDGPSWKNMVPQLLYVKIKDRINMTWFYFAISFMKEVSWFTGLSLSNNLKLCKKKRPILAKIHFVE
jgi:hypothetical protein